MFFVRLSHCCAAPTLSWSRRNIDDNRSGIKRTLVYGEFDSRIALRGEIMSTISTRNPTDNRDDPKLLVQTKNNRFVVAQNQKKTATFAPLYIQNKAFVTNKPS